MRGSKTRQPMAAFVLLGLSGFLLSTLAGWISAAPGDSNTAMSIVERTSQIIGLAPEALTKTCASEVVTLRDTTTPFLGQFADHRRVWCLRFEAPSLAVADDSVVSIGERITAYADSASGAILKIVWDLAPLDTALDIELGSEYSEFSMRRSGDVYTGFPDSIPTVTFGEAVLACPHRPLEARQIVGQYVLWSYAGRQERPVWAITLRGIPPLTPYGGPSCTSGEQTVPEYQRNRVRCIVSVPAGKCIESGTVPPVPLKPRDRQRLFGE